MAANAELLTSEPQVWPIPPMVLDFHGAPLTDEQFETLCLNSDDEFNFELSADGELIVVPPTLPDTGWKNSRLTARLETWSEQDGTGIAFDSSTMFTFPNGAKRAPDASWMTLEKWEAMPRSERGRVAGRGLPDFVVELLSPSDRLARIKKKMTEYIENGVRLGWLIDPEHRRVHVYRVDRSTEELDDPEYVDGEDVLKGFRLNVREMW